ncbi:MAG TPA: competence protein CoiA family protein [Tetragenococcus sp.]|nr:competence protein CoiA family protein [Tetragenococcus sp.]
MLIAQSEKGQLVDSRHYHKKKEELFCPSCHQAVVFRKGKVKISHFAHKAHSCCTSFSEGETKEHLQGKLLLEQWFPGGELEAYLPKLKQRPDLLLKKMPIEVQCSPLPIKRFMQRNQNYLAYGYYPWWLLGEKLAPKRHFGPIQKGSTYFYHGCLCLWLIRPFKKELCLLYDIKWHYHFGMSYQIINWSAFETIKLDFSQQQNGFLWKAQDYRYFIYRKLADKNIRTIRLQEKLYFIHLTVQDLPDWCYLPSFFHFFFEDDLLFLRACFIKASDFNHWLQMIKGLEHVWLYPFISQKKVLWQLYQECRKLCC